jgi:histidine triad (HIT) family protein
MDNQNNIEESCIFCKIAEKGVHKGVSFWENETHVAFLDINPSKKGHTLVVPKKHSTSHMELNEHEYTQLWQAVRTVAKIVEEVLSPKVVSVVIEGLEVPHTHVHIIPLHEGEKLAHFEHISLNHGEQDELRKQLTGVQKNNE